MSTLAEKEILNAGWLPFAQVGRPHGLKGGFFLKTSDRRMHWDNYKVLLLESSKGFREVKVLNAFVSGKALVVQLETLASREEVEALYNKKLYVHKKEIPLEEDEILVSELTGFQVIAENKGILGEVVQLVSFGAQENLEIKLTDKETTVLFPFIEQFIKNVDKNKRTIEILYTPEFFEDM